MPNPDLNINEDSGVDWNTEIDDSAPEDDLYLLDDQNTPSKSRGYRPKAWDEPETKELFYISDSKGNDYFFDGVFKTEHTSKRRLTQHPVQTGANITDHSYQIPMSLMLEVGVSDSMDVYRLSWSGNAKSKSVNAYQKLREIQDSGQPLKVITRMCSYENMVIESVTIQEDYKSLYSMKAGISFQQIIISDVAMKKISASKQTTEVNTSATKQPLSANDYNSEFSKLLPGVTKFKEDILKAWGLK